MIKILQVVVVAFVCFSAQAQVNSGSDGHDGAFNPTTNTVVNTADHPDGIYHYTSVNISNGVTVTFIPNANNTPVIWLVQSNCVISGEVDVSGKNGQDAGAAGLGGPGGYRGGNRSAERDGQGPGGGPAYNFGGNASYGTRGSWDITYHLSSPLPYGNIFLIPLLGGSGGGSSVYSTYPGGGGGGGGAILIAAATITLNGSLSSHGGNGGSGAGGGSGGAVRFVGSIINGAGAINTSGGIPANFGGFPAGTGRVRFDALVHNYAGSTSGVFSQGFQPTIIPASGQGAQLTVTSVGGVPVSASPTGVLTTPDAVLSAQQNNPIPIVVQCSNIPLNTLITVSVLRMNGSPITAVGYNNTGTLASSTASVLINIPRGGGLIYATAATSP